MYRELGWESLQSRRNKHKLVVLYNILHGSAQIILLISYPDCTGNNKVQSPLLRSYTELQGKYKSFSGFILPVHYSSLEQPADGNKKCNILINFQILTQQKHAKTTKILQCWPSHRPNPPRETTYGM